MRVNQRIALILLVALAAFAIAASGQGQQTPSYTVFVQPDELIQAAIDKASDGAVICLGEGTWQENIKIEKSLTLRGTGRENSAIEGTKHGRPVLQIDSETEIIVHVESLTIQGAKGGPKECAAVYPIAPKTICPDGIAIQGKSKVFLLKLAVGNNGRMGIYATDSSSVTMDQCSVLGSGRIGVFVRRYATGTIEQTAITNNNEGVMIADSATALLSDCTITDSASYGLYVGGHPECVLADCTVRNNGNNGIALGGDAHVSLVRCKVTANKAWGIVKTSYPQRFTGTLKIDDESVINGNEYPGIGSM